MLKTLCSINNSITFVEELDVYNHMKIDAQVKEIALPIKNLHRQDATHSGTTKFNPNGTISIKDTVQNPARALEYMIDGLERQDKRDDFVINMGTYGDYGIIGKNLKKVCYGCAATCTIQEISGKNLTYIDNPHKENGFRILKSNLKVRFIRSFYERAKFLNFSKGELVHFEGSIDNARRGNLYPLYKFFNIYSTKEEFYKDIIFKSDMMNAEGLSSYKLRTYNWKENLSYYKDLIKMLRRNNPNWN